MERATAPGAVRKADKAFFGPLEHEAVRVGTASLCIHFAPSPAVLDSGDRTAADTPDLRRLRAAWEAIGDANSFSGRADGLLKLQVHSLSLPHACRQGGENKAQDLR